MKQGRDMRVIKSEMTVVESLFMRQIPNVVSSKIITAARKTIFLAAARGRHLPISALKLHDFFFFFSVNRKKKYYFSGEFILHACRQQIVHMQQIHSR